MRRVNLLPNFITAFGLSCGLFVIFWVNMTGSSTFEMLYHMTLVLLLAGIADLLDGAVARAIKAESEFGLIFDSLADAISFGVAPSILLLKSLSLDVRDGFAFFALACAMLYTVCGVLRLVRFNIKAAQAKSEEAITAKKTFIGLPIPAAAAAGVAPILLANSPCFEAFFHFSLMTKSIVLPSIMIVIGYLMISRFRFPSLKNIHFRVPSFNLVFFATLIAMLVVYGVLFYLSILLLILSWGYVLLGLTLGFIRMIKGRKTKTLEDFDPEDPEK